MADFHMHPDASLKGQTLPAGHDGMMLVNGVRSDCEVCSAKPDAVKAKATKQPIV